MCEWKTMDTAPNGDLSAAIDIWDGFERKTDCCWTTPDNKSETAPCWCYAEYEAGRGWCHYPVIDPKFWMCVATPPAS